MRTRSLDSLTNADVTDYLERNDIIFVPVGTVEMFGELPLGAEHVVPLAFAQRMAEEADGLVLPHLAYFYPGATVTGRGTVHMSLTAGVAYLKEICYSLLRQGFRRQILVTAHGPAYLTASSVVREFIQDTRCPMAYCDLTKVFDRIRESAGARLDWNMFLAAYHMLGRLEEIPTDREPTERVPAPEALERFYARAGGDVGYCFSDMTHHGWWPETRITTEERLARAEDGREQIELVIKHIDPKALVEDLRELDHHLQREVWPKYGDHVPPRLPSV